MSRSAAAAFVNPVRDPSGVGGFDFLHGEWRAHHRKLKQRLAGSDDWIEFSGALSVRPILGGGGNIDELSVDDPNGAYHGSSVRLFDSTTGRWSIYWMDSRYPGIEPPMVGEMVDGRATLFGDETFEGKPIRVRFIYQRLGDDGVHWEQAFSADGGATWETNWVMDFTRV